MNKAIKFSLPKSALAICLIPSLVIPLLIPLVIKGKEIHNEEEDIKEKIENENKLKQKKEILLNLRRFKKIDREINEKSPYPKLILDIENTDRLISKPIINSNNQNSECYEEKILNSSVPESNRSNATLGPYFLEAYKKIAIPCLQKIDLKEKKDKQNFNFIYSHPGTYRIFKYIEKIKNKTNDKKQSEKDKKPEEEKTIEISKWMWSCCMNEDKNSKGCKIKKVKNFKWIFDP
jgi:hypothetical protein